MTDQPPDPSQTESLQQPAPARRGGRSRYAPTPKPVEMMERVMRSSLRAGELALEPFIGTGSTLITAHRSGRRCSGMELEPIWVDVAVKRWQAFAGQEATLEGDGRTFAEVSAERAVGPTI